MVVEDIFSTSIGIELGLSSRNFKSGYGEQSIF